MRLLTTLARSWRCPATYTDHAWRALSASASPFTISGELPKLARGEIPALGVEASVTHTFELADTTTFAALAGDSNPIHTDAAYAKAHAGAASPVVQGMLTAGLFATIFGRSIPGAVYISQQLRWRTPLLVGQAVRARIRVTRVRKRFVDCETIAERVHDGALLVEGHAIVLLPATAGSPSGVHEDTQPFA